MAPDGDDLRVDGLADGELLPLLVVYSEHDHGGSRDRRPRLRPCRLDSLAHRSVISRNRSKKKSRGEGDSMACSPPGLAALGLLVVAIQAPALAPADPDPWRRVRRTPPLASSSVATYSPLGLDW